MVFCALIGCLVNCVCAPKGHYFPDVFRGESLPQRLTAKLSNCVYSAVQENAAISRL